LSNTHESFFLQEKLEQVLRLNTSVYEMRNKTEGDGHLAVVNGETFDWCVNCTYNQICPIQESGCYYEVCLTLIYQEKEKKSLITGITIMDGEFCSLYPYVLDEQDLEKPHRRYTLTHVKHTPMMKSKDIVAAQAFMAQVSSAEVRSRIPSFVEGISTFFPSFNDEFVFDSWFVSMKTKPVDAGAANHTASRQCIAERDGRCISILSGKINTLFEAERVVLSEVLQEWSQRK
jgi:hypothetical protein